MPKAKAPRATRTSFYLVPRFQIACVVISCFVLYGNTLKNRFALDDGLGLTDNKYVQAGLSGIPEILFHDSFHGAIGEAARPPGGPSRRLRLHAFAGFVETLVAAPGGYGIFSCSS